MTSEHPIRNKIGTIIGGSFERGLQVKLDTSVITEELPVDSFAIIQGTATVYFGMVTNITIESAANPIQWSALDITNRSVSELLKGTTTYSMADVKPILSWNPQSEKAPTAAKTLPEPFSNVYTAAEYDIQTIFGSDENSSHFAIGTPLDMDVNICLDIQQLVERSSGVFGKAGTGKSFLTRLLLIGILKSGLATNLIFDMAGEYGWEGYSESNTRVKGLKQLFPGKVAVFSLDSKSPIPNNRRPDATVSIPYSEIEPEDIKALQETLNLSDIAADAAYSLERHLGQARWLKEFLEHNRAGLNQLSDDIGVNQSALATLHNRLGRLARLDFISETGRFQSIQELLQYLENGRTVVLDFGPYANNLTAYILMANVLTRRIHQQYRERKERASGNKNEEPIPLVITIEEAHKFLNPSVAGQTIFGTIAREMRKYNVTLLVVDQRPGAIDSEVMSQLGTKLTCLLDDDRDTDAVLAGTPARRELRSTISRLDSRQQALIFGHAVPMPIVIRTREYGSEESYKSIGASPDSISTDEPNYELKQLFGDDEP